MSEKLTVLIPCKDESHNIRDCIESVRTVADEILVADSLSTDNTLEIVRELGGCRIIEREFVDYADFKNWAIPQATHSWVLVVDADERVTPELAAEIREILTRENTSLDAYSMQRENYFLGARIRHCGWNRTRITRLFRRDACRYGAPRVHEQLNVPADRTGMLHSKLLHYTCTSFTQFIEKQIRYARIWAEDHHAIGRRTNWFGILLRPPLRFFQFYILRGGFLDGTVGLIICLSSAFYTFLKYANLWQLRQVMPRRKLTVVPPESRITKKAG